MASLARVVQWGEQADVIVLGSGVAGMAAAVEAYDADPAADVLIVEKMPERHAGGNSRVAGQTLCFPSDAESLATYQRALSAPMTVSEELLQAWAQARFEQKAWLERMAAEVGMEVYYWEGWAPGPDFPELPGSECIDGLWSVRPAEGKPTGDRLHPSTLWNLFRAHLERRPIRVVYETRALDLVQDPDSLEVFGVLSVQDGRELAIRAARGVVVAVGGYEANLEMQGDYAGFERIYTMGSPANTGDGVRMLQKAGADLWHLRTRIYVSGMQLGIKVPEYPSVFVRSSRIKAGSWIDVGADDRRFYDEAPPAARVHYKRKAHGNWVDMPYANVLPVHMILDETTRRRDAVGDREGTTTWNVVVEGYRWSPDNSAELERGWIVQAGSIRELAERIGRDADELEATVARWNASCAAGRDDEFGRDPERMAPIETPPFYAVELVPVVGTTSGGARRDARAQVLDHRGVPIPRLYEAGELGSMNCNLYQTGSFLTEAMVTGRLAGAAAAAEPAWTDAPSPVGAGAR